MRIGFHFPFSGSLNKLKEKVAISRGNTFQIFARGLRGGNIQKISARQLPEFIKFMNEKNISPIVLHAPYTYNLAKEEGEEEGYILEDLAMAKKIGAQYYVLQPGYSKGIHPLMAMEHVKMHLLTILSQTEWDGIILIKNMAGAGSEMASSLGEWNELISFHPKIKGALDFARAYSAGYGFTNEEDAKVFIRQIEDEVSWEKIHLLYINDSDRFCGSKKNNYTPLGDGVINYNGYEHLLSHEIIKEKIWIVENQPDLMYVDRSIQFLTSFYEGKES